MTAFSPALPGTPIRPVRPTRPVAALQPATTARIPQACPRTPDLPQEDGGAALVALALAVPAAILAVVLWFAFQGGSVWQLAGIYALSGNLTFWAALAGLGALRRRPRAGR